MVSCGGAAAIPGRQRSTGKISGFDVVDGSVRIYVRSMVGEPGRGLSGANDDDSVLVAVVGWHRDGWWACCVGGAGRDLREVGVGGGDWCGGPRRGRALMLRAASSRVASWRSGRTRPVPQGVERADGRGVVMGCDEPLARGGGAVARVGAVWFGANRVCRRAFRDAAGLLVVAWRAATLSRGCHKRRETWWDGGRYVETISAGQREGRDGLGRVNMA